MATKIETLLANATERANEFAQTLVGQLDVADDAVSLYGQQIIDLATHAKIAKSPEGAVAFYALFKNESMIEGFNLGIVKKTHIEMARSAVCCWWHGVEFYASAKNEPEMTSDVPNAFGKVKAAGEAKKSGARVATVIGTNASAAAKAAETVATTSKALPRPQLDALLRTTLKALRDAGLIETAAEVLDVFLEIDGFTESVKS